MDITANHVDLLTGKTNFENNDADHVSGRGNGTQVGVGGTKIGFSGRGGKLSENHTNKMLNYYSTKPIINGQEWVTNFWIAYDSLAKYFF